MQAGSDILASTFCLDYSRPVNQVLSAILLTEGHELGVGALKIVQQLPALVLSQLIVGWQGVEFTDPELDLLLAHKIWGQPVDLQTQGQVKTSDNQGDITTCPGMLSKKQATSRVTSRGFTSTQA